MEKIDIAALKRRGYINQKDREFFTVRLKIQAGNINSHQMIKVSEIAMKYGRGYVGLTTRLGIEIPWIKASDLENVQTALGEVGLAPGGTGPTVRPIVACKGTICTFGLVDTQAFCKQLDERHFGVEVAAKCKIGITGCPNNCAKAQLNDIGFMGQCLPKLQEDKCTKCGMCISSCKEKAILLTEDGVSIDFDKCIKCGVCTRVCKTQGIYAHKQGVAIYLGGRFGRRYRLGREQPGILTMEQAVELTGRILEFYRSNALKGERLSDMVERLGTKSVL